MQTFDYYVSGIKLNHQVPRFETAALQAHQATTVKLNDWLQTYPLTVLIFAELRGESALLKPDAMEGVQLAYVSKLPLDILKTLNQKDAIILSDESLSVSESYGALDERTGKIIPSLVVIGASGNCLAHHASPTLNTPKIPQLLSLLEGIRLD